MFDFLLLLLVIFSPLIVIITIVSVAIFISNRNNNTMDPNQLKPKTSATDIFLNLGAFISLYTLLASLLGLLFTVIDTAYPQIINGSNYAGSASISLPVSVLIVFFPIFILLMWFLEKQYKTHPETQNSVIHRGFTYITLFISGLIIAGDLITVVYYFVDGEELTAGFLLKVIVLLVVASGIFIYFISDLRGKLTSSLRVSWRFFAAGILFVSIVWGFMVLGSPRTQRLYKYDQQKVTDLQNLNNQVTNYFASKGMLPDTLSEISAGNYYVTSLIDPQSQQPYEYDKTSNTTYDLCADFNKATNAMNNLNPYTYGTSSWTHSAGHYCFSETINPNLYAPRPAPVN